MLTPEQLEGLRSRFQHFDADKAAPLFAGDQPEEGLHTVRGQGKYPAVYMRNGTTWFYDKANRPVTATGAPMKAKAPKGMRPLLHDGHRPEGIVVEGEGAAVALLSLGVSGVVATGGTQTLLSKKAKSRAHCSEVLRGRKLRWLYDTDEAGRQGVTKAVAAAFEAGAAGNLVMDQVPWESGDLEDWLNGWDTPERAAGELVQWLGTRNWDDAVAVEDQEERAKDEENAAVAVHSWRQGSPPQAAAVLTYDEATGKVGMAVYKPGESVQADVVWRIMDEWRHGDHVYKPRTDEDTLDELRTRTLIAPPPPAEDYGGSSEQLWRDLRAFMQEWLALPDARAYDVMVAYVLLTYRLKDAGFQMTPYLRFWGPSGSGKGRALDVMRSLCFRSYKGAPSTDNLHLVIDALGDVTLVIDEFDLKAEGMQKVAGVLNAGYDASHRILRAYKRPNGKMVMQRFVVFGPKITAGYQAHDDEQGLARRTLAVRLEAGLKLRQEAEVFELPDSFWRQAAELRARLLAWRGAKIALPKPETRGHRTKRIIRDVGRGSGQVYWSLSCMVPEGMAAELDNLVEFAQGRRADLEEMNKATAESDLVAAVASLIQDGVAPTVDGRVFVPTAALLDELRESANVVASASQVVRDLTALGMRQCRARVGGANPVRGVTFELDSKAVRTAFRDAGLSDSDLDELLREQPTEDKPPL